MACCHLGVFGEAAIALSADVPRGGEVLAIVLLQAGLDQDTLADSRIVDLCPDRHDLAADISALNAWEMDRLAGPAGIFRVTFSLGIPRQAGIDVGIVDAFRADSHQYVTRAGCRARNVITHFQDFRAAMAGQIDALHAVIAWGK